MNAESERVDGGVGCAGARLLRRALERNPLHLSGGSGGRHSIGHGFARADVVSMALAGARGRGLVALSEPWRPEREEGEPIRFFYVVTDIPGEVRPRTPLLPEGVRIEARLASGQVIELRP